VKSLFGHNPLASVGQMLQLLRKNHPDTHQYTDNWRLFVCTTTLDEKHEKIKTYTQIDNDMPFLSIPEYVLEKSLTICTDNYVNAENRAPMGMLMSGIATQQDLIESANITVVSEIQYFQNKINESSKTVYFAKNHLQCSAATRKSYIQISENCLASNRRLYAAHISDALKHQATQKNVFLVHA